MRVEVEAQKVDETFESVTKDFRREASLPGFRPGKAPKDMVLRKYEKDIQDETKRKLISEAYRKAIEEQMDKFSQKRWESQPAQPSAGCIFKNPKEIPAGKLIDELGLRGKSIGGAMVSDVHGNFIVNTGGATASDVLRLIEFIQQLARSKRKIELETEVEIIGE